MSFSNAGNSSDRDGSITADISSGSELYVNLLKQCLTRKIFETDALVDVMGWPEGGALGSPEDVWRVLRENKMRIVRPANRQELEGYRTGEKWHPYADTMIGVQRLDNVHELASRVIEAGVPGDLVEAGVWRGGVLALMRAILRAQNQSDRHVWGFDSFKGLPDPDLERYPQDAQMDRDANYLPHIGVTKEDVERNIRKYGLLDEGITLVEGWFKDTLPNANVEKIALLRLDGDMYESTMDSLEYLEPKVSQGGFIIIDDYNSWEPCKAAVHDYREKKGIDASINPIDWTGIWWQK